MTINSVTLVKDLLVSFDVKDADDANNPYVGTIVGADLDWSIARSYGDLQVAHARMTFEGTTPDVETLNYFLLRLESGVIIPIAAEWVDAATFTSVTAPPDDVTIVVKQLPAAQIAMVLNVIRSLGYSCTSVATS